jgi:hypothetical protein
MSIFGKKQRSHWKALEELEINKLRKEIEQLRKPLSLIETDMIEFLSVLKQLRNKKARFLGPARARWGSLSRRSQEWGFTDAIWEKEPIWESMQRLELTTVKGKYETFHAKLKSIITTMDVFDGNLNKIRKENDLRKLEDLGQAAHQSWLDLATALKPTGVDIKNMGQAETTLKIALDMIKETSITFWIQTPNGFNMTKIFDSTKEIVFGRGLFPGLPKEVSRKHYLIKFEKERAIFTDLGATNKLIVTETDNLVTTFDNYTATFALSYSSNFYFHFPGKQWLFSLGMING